MGFSTMLKPRLVSLKSLAQEIGANCQSIRRALAIAKIDAVKLTPSPNSRVYYVRYDVDRWLKTLTRFATDPNQDGAAGPVGPGSRT